MFCWYYIRNKLREQSAIFALLLHSTVVQFSLLKLGNLTRWIHCRMTSFVTVYTPMLSELMLSKWQQKKEVTFKSRILIICHTCVCTFCITSWTEAVDWDSWWGVGRLSLSITESSIDFPIFLFLEKKFLFFNRLLFFWTAMLLDTLSEDVLHKRTPQEK